MLPAVLIVGGRGVAVVVRDQNVQEDAVGHRQQAVDVPALGRGHRQVRVGQDFPLPVERVVGPFLLLVRVVQVDLARRQVHAGLFRKRANGQGRSGLWILLLVVFLASIFILCLVRFLKVGLLQEAEVAVLLGVDVHAVDLQFSK